MARELPACFRFRRTEDPAADPSEFGAILQLENNAIVRLRHQIECRHRFAIVKIAQDNDEASLFEHAGQFAHPAPKKCPFVEAIPAQPMQPKENLPVRKCALHFNPSLATPDDPPGTDSTERRERKATGDLHSPRILAQRV